MFQKVLIANRGEIAVRIIQACRDLGIISVAVYSEADREALHAQIADEAVCIGPARAAESYLNMDNIISAALASGCQAIHPGFGFLSENPDFAERTTQAGLAFIGPTAATIRLMGDKSEAKRNAIAAGVPVALGTDGAASNNNLNIMQDMYLFGVVYKGFFRDSTLITPAEVLHAATRAGALSQGREDSGRLAVGMRADLCAINTDTPQFTPMTDAACNVVYAAQGADIRMTMVDGEILYRDGEFKTIDIEKVKAEVQRRTDSILSRL